MRYRNWTIRLSLIASVVAISGCVTSVDTACDVIRQEIRVNPEIAQVLVRTDRASAEQIAAINQFYVQNCG